MPVASFRTWPCPSTGDKGMTHSVMCVTVVLPSRESEWCHQRYCSGDGVRPQVWPSSGAAMELVTQGPLPAPHPHVSFWVKSR